MLERRALMDASIQRHQWTTVPQEHQHHLLKAHRESCPARINRTPSAERPATSTNGAHERCRNLTAIRFLSNLRNQSFRAHAQARRWIASSWLHTVADVQLMKALETQRATAPCIVAFASMSLTSSFRPYHTVQLLCGFWSGLGTRFAIVFGAWRVFTLLLFVVVSDTTGRYR